MPIRGSSQISIDGDTVYFLSPAVNVAWMPPAVMFAWKLLPQVAAKRAAVVFVSSGFTPNARSAE